MRWSCLVAASTIWLLACADSGGPLFNSSNPLAPDPGPIPSPTAGPITPSPTPFPTPTPLPGLTPIPNPGPIPNPTPTPSLIPLPVTQTFSDSLGPDDGCTNVGSQDIRPCRRYLFSTAAGGTLRVTLTWAGNTDLNLELWRGTTRLISVTGGGNSETMIAELPAGSYEVRVIYFSGSLTQSYQLEIDRPG